MHSKQASPSPPLRFLFFTYSIDPPFPKFDRVRFFFLTGLDPDRRRFRTKRIGSEWVYPVKSLLTLISCQRDHDLHSTAKPKRRRKVHGLP